ncbi:MAG: hypothetical protein AAB495_04435 [Patescibacteria group bacterium]
MKNKLVSLVVIVFLLVGATPALVRAETLSTEALQALITSLLQQIAYLQEQLNKIKGGGTTPSVPPVPQPPTLVPTTPTVLYPNGGETLMKCKGWTPMVTTGISTDFMRSCYLSLTWLNPTKGGVDLALIPANTSSYVPHRIYQNLPWQAGDKQVYQWKIGSADTYKEEHVVPDGVYYLRVCPTGAAKESACDMSDAPFKLVSEGVPPVPQPPTLVPTTPTVLYPNGGETLMRGRSMTITWLNPSRKPVNLYLQSSGLLIAINIPWQSGDKQVYTWNTGVFKEAYAPDGKYYIQVCPVDATSKSECDASNEAFSIVSDAITLPPYEPPVVTPPTPAGGFPTVLYPNNGETLMRRTTSYITWMSGGVNIGANIFLIPAGVVSYTPYVIAMNIPWRSSDKQSFEWGVGVVSGAGGLDVPDGYYYIQVCNAYSDKKDGECDRSNSPVRIISPTLLTPSTPKLTLTSPNGGETWRMGNIKTVAWKAENLVGDIEIYLLGTGNSYMCYMGKAPVSAGWINVNLPRNYECPGLSVTVKPGIHVVGIFANNNRTDVLWAAKDASDGTITVVDPDAPTTSGLPGANSQVATVLEAMRALLREISGGF